MEVLRGHVRVKVKSVEIGPSCKEVCLQITLPTSAGIFIELVANPMPNAMADSTPTNSATSCSSSRRTVVLPV